MPFSRPDTFWATIRLRIEETGPGSHMASIVRNQSFNGEVQIERGWDVDGPALIHLRLASNAQLDPDDSFLIVQQSRPREFDYLEALEAEHIDDRTITVIAWPYLSTPDVPDAGPEAPTCTFEVDLLVLRVA